MSKLESLYNTAMYLRDDAEEDRDVIDELGKKMGTRFWVRTHMKEEEDVWEVKKQNPCNQKAFGRNYSHGDWLWHSFGGKTRDYMTIIEVDDQDESIKFVNRENLDSFFAKSPNSKDSIFLTHPNWIEMAKEYNGWAMHRNLYKYNAPETFNMCGYDVSHLVLFNNTPIIRSKTIKTPKSDPKIYLKDIYQFIGWV
jgi:hypothetical protein